MTSNQEAKTWTPEQNDDGWSLVAYEKNVNRVFYAKWEHEYEVKEDAEYINALEQSLTAERLAGEAWKGLYNMAQVNADEAIKQLTAERQQREAAEAELVREKNMIASLVSSSQKQQAWINDMRDERDALRLQLDAAREALGWIANKEPSSKKLTTGDAYSMQRCAGAALSEPQQSAS